jgi:SAM-dependent methyltransferase
MTVYAIFLDQAHMQPEVEAKILPFDEVLDLLVSPDSGRPLTLRQNEELFDGENKYPIMHDKPILLPRRILKYYGERGLSIPFSKRTSPDYQYFFISQLKTTSGANNDPPDDPWNLKHLDWSRDLLRDASGLVLDIGCDDPVLSASLLSGRAQYVGLDPVSHQGKTFRVIGMGEFLPFRRASFDGAIFLTSLDHISDWHQALDETYRVLKPGGKLYISSLIWHARASLLRDTVHFRHFREFELLGGLANAGFTTGQPKYFPWKDNDHRKVIQLVAAKLGQG